MFETDRTKGAAQSAITRFWKVPETFRAVKPFLVHLCLKTECKAFGNFLYEGNLKVHVGE